ncbi:DUF4114 domain-containing protein [Iningainema tapete]|uniref:DUF4114 domain-containing protein n=1 Tax=Iningainema tapete BLCC-T55 TaxID=2748662 RepID=A0A8J7BYJ7_9CYAN|nr:DUF4114 domain-containing protein [Iningainema tapete]MBD2775862.1 DUF4114 domain-containing protein [Iningainema tapete BLCC-T55]
MKNHIFTLLIAAGTLASSLLSAVTPANAINIRSRDEASVEFQNILPDLGAFVGAESRYLSPEQVKDYQVDISRLSLLNDNSVKVFFIGETAGAYRNRLDYKTTYGNEVETGKIFGDTSCNPGDSGFTNFSSFCQNPDQPLPGKVAPDSPLNVGDWVDLGVFKAGTKFDFLLQSNDINGGIYNDGIKGIFGIYPEENPDKVQHTVSYLYNDYLILGFEDLWGGGDRDYNDTVFAIDFGRQNISVSVPEPSVTISVIGVAALCLLATRRRSTPQS